MNILPDKEYCYSFANQGQENALEQIAILTPKHRPLNEYVLGLTSSARTATVNGNNFCTLGSKGITVFLSMTATTTALGVYPVIDFVDSLAGTVYTPAYTLSPLVAIANGLYAWTFYPALTSPATAFASFANFVLPLYMRVRIVHNDALTVTYSVNVCLLP